MGIYFFILNRYLEGKINFRETMDIVPSQPPIMRHTARRAAEEIIAATG